MAWGKSSASSFPVKLTAVLSLILGAFLLTASSCGPPLPPTPKIKVPSKVVTEAGTEFFVYRLKLPGTMQELKLKQAGGTTWVPLSVIQFIFFTGPEVDRYRQGKIVLTSGERMQGDIFVDTLIEGTTDVGYWNIPLREVRQMSIGEE